MNPERQENVIPKRSARVTFHYQTPPPLPAAAAADLWLVVVSIDKTLATQDMRVTHLSIFEYFFFKVYRVCVGIKTLN